LRSRHNTKNSIISSRTQEVLGLILEKLSHKKKVRILEIGCNSGMFLSELKTSLKSIDTLSNCELVGIDIDQNSINNRVDEELNLYCSSVEDFLLDESQNKFDIVLHFELVEHLSDPYNFFLNIHKILMNDGLHYFHTPNLRGLDNLALSYNSYRPLAHGIFPPMHLQGFTPESILHFGIRTGYKVKSIKTPGIFDVSIVSENLWRNQTPYPFNLLEKFDHQDLGIIQSIISALNCSSHMTCLLEK
jgi:SAM-dependent methyltransferase